MHTGSLEANCFVSRPGCFAIHVSARATGITGRSPPPFRTAGWEWAAVLLLGAAGGSVAVLLLLRARARSPGQSPRAAQGQSRHVELAILSEERPLLSTDREDSQGRRRGEPGGPEGSEASRPKVRASTVLLCCCLRSCRRWVLACPADFCACGGQQLHSVGVRSGSGLGSFLGVHNWQQGAVCGDWLHAERHIYPLVCPAAGHQQAPPLLCIAALPLLV
jgi:hypothetical protein